MGPDDLGPDTVLEFPDGTRIWREDTTPNRVRHESPVGPSQGRQRVETGTFAEGEHTAQAIMTRAVVRPSILDSAFSATIRGAD